jgi:hypothetical protein
MLSQFMEEEKASEWRRVAEMIVDIITIERGGRFLKLREGHHDDSYCSLMSRKICISKVVHALRSAKSRSNRGKSEPSTCERLTRSERHRARSKSSFDGDSSIMEEEFESPTKIVRLSKKSGRAARTCQRCRQFGGAFGTKCVGSRGRLGQTACEYFSPSGKHVK